MLFLWLTGTLANLFWGPLHFLESNTMNKWCENLSLVAHLGKTQGDDALLWVQAAPGDGQAKQP